MIRMIRIFMRMLRISANICIFVAFGFLFVVFVLYFMKHITKVVIPATGFGTRFLPQTKAMPKEMLPVVDKPVIQYVVGEAIDSNVKNNIIVTGSNKRAIEDHFDAPSEDLVKNLLQGKRTFT